MDSFWNDQRPENPWIHEFLGQPETGKRRRSGGGTPPPAEPAPDACEVSLTDVALEDVAESEHFELLHGVPVAGTAVAVRFQRQPGRILVETRADRIALGYLPLKYLGLRRCTDQGWIYAGRITVSTGGDSPVIRVNLSPVQRPAN
jgi:hypothetical protein